MSCTGNDEQAMSDLIDKGIYEQEMIFKEWLQLENAIEIVLKKLNEKMNYDKIKY